MIFLKPYNWLFEYNFSKVLTKITVKALYTANIVLFFANTIKQLHCLLPIFTGKIYLYNEQKSIPSTRIRLISGLCAPPVCSADHIQFFVEGNDG